MEISEVVNTQFVFPGLVVGLVLICAALVFVFGFKSVEDFPFDKLATVADDRKPAGKKRKVKDKKSQSNGQATVVSETKQKSLEAVSTKSAFNKTRSPEKSPVKDAPKPNTKQEKKQTKLEPSPVKAALKDTKNIKDLNKITDENQKQGKVKDVQKQEKNQQSNKQGKSKGKENVEVKNKKNVEKSKNKSVEKPEDDEGEWEQATSRRDKKNRKLPTSDDENMVGKSVKVEVASPGKKKKSKITQEPSAANESEPSHKPPQVDKVVTPPAPVAEVIPEPQKEAKEKPSKKEKEAKKDKPKPVIEEATVVESPVASVENENESKAGKKKKKKSAGKDNSETAIPEVEEKAVAKETSVPVTKAPVPEPKQTKEPATENTPAFDELGDSWVEAKPQKKASKKKVRKAE